MNARIEALAAWLDTALLAADPVPDVLERARDLTVDEAYRLQHAVMERRVAQGDRVVGYKAALTSAAMRAETGIPEPLVGTLLASRVFPEGEPVSLAARGFMRATLEPEVAVLLGRDLAGPGVSVLDARAAVAGYLPAVELGDYRVAQGVRSIQSAVACNTYSGGIIVGGPLTSPFGIDLRVEGMAMHHNGKPAGSGTGIEVLGDPLAAVALIANTLAEHGLGLAAGMLLMTGSITRSIPLAAGDAVRVAFTRLGSLCVRIAV